MTRSNMVIFLFAFLVDGVFGDTESVMEGNSVILNTDATKEHIDIILWYFNNTRIALIDGSPSTRCVYDGEGGRFRGRLEVDCETGSLTIINITTEHAGRYEAEIIRGNISGKSESLNRNRVETNCNSTNIILKSGELGEIIKSFSLTVSGVFGDSESVMEGNSVILNTDATKTHHDRILWYFNNIRLALINGEASTSCVYDGEGGRFRDRLEVDYETGSLTITNITSEHAGRYEAEIIRSESSGKRQSLNRNRKCDSTKIILKSGELGEIIKSFSLTVSASDSGENKNKGLTDPQDKEMEKSSGLSTGEIAGIVGVVVGVVLLVAAVVVGRKKFAHFIFIKFEEKQSSEKQVPNDETQNEKSLMI